METYPLQDLKDLRVCIFEVVSQQLISVSRADGQSKFSLTLFCASVCEEASCPEVAIPRMADLHEVHTGGFACKEIDDQSVLDMMGRDMATDY